MKYMGYEEMLKYMKEKFSEVISECIKKSGHDIGLVDATSVEAIESVMSDFMDQYYK